ncbi:hypothetical protein TcCL_Unassigned01428 [Trypanosoma cruzi]|nr:hypothetical protein TcCL_Unassigned01428 [Trypanosoma cruzi]
MSLLMVLGDGMGDAGSGFLVNLFWFFSRLGEQTVSTPWVCVFLLGFLPNGHHRLPFSSLVRGGGQCVTVWLKRCWGPLLLCVCVHACGLGLATVAARCRRRNTQGPSK